MTKMQEMTQIYQENVDQEQQSVLQEVENLLESTIRQAQSGLDLIRRLRAEGAEFVIGAATGVAGDIESKGRSLRDASNALEAGRKTRELLRSIQHAGEWDAKHPQA